MNGVRSSVIDMLKNAPSNSLDFKNTLYEATIHEIKCAVTFMFGKPGCKKKMAKCERMLRIKMVLEDEKDI